VGGGPGCPLAASHVGVRRGAKLGADWTILLDVSRHFICAQHSTDHTQPSALLSLSLSLSRYVMWCHRGKATRPTTQQFAPVPRRFMAPQHPQLQGGTDLCTGLNF